MDTGFPLDRWTGRRLGERGLVTRAALRDWQLVRLNGMLAHIRRESPFYRALAPRLPGALVDLRDIAALPLTTAEDLIRAEPPLATMPQARANRLVTLPTSGTTGLPKRVVFSSQDIDATVDFFHHGMSVVARPGDRVVIGFAADRAGSIGHGLSLALRRLGAKPIIVPGPMAPEDLAAFIWAEQATVVVGQPVPLLAAARVSAHDGGPPLRVRAALVSGDHAAPSLVAALGRLWSCAVYQHWGMTEIGYGGAIDCRCHAGLHIREADLIVEVIDPETGAPVADGTVGEVVVTTLSQDAQPLLRYRTGDLARLESGPCACGSVLKRLVGFSGRLGATVPLPLGGPLSLAALDEALFGLDAISDVRATVLDLGDPVEVLLTVATPANVRRPNVLHDVRVALSRDPVLAPALANGHLRVTVDLAPGAACSPNGKRRLAFAAAASGMVA